MNSLIDFLTTLFPNALLQTLYMVIVPTIVATILGFILAIILVVTKPDGLKPNSTINRWNKYRGNCCNSANNYWGSTVYR